MYRKCFVVLTFFAMAMAQKKDIVLKAASVVDNCGCQCDNYVFLDGYGRRQGNCNSVDSSGAQWCYVEYGNTCTDVRYSDRRDGRGRKRLISSEACATPACNRGGGYPGGRPFGGNGGFFGGGNRPFGGGNGGSFGGGNHPFGGGSSGIFGGSGSSHGGGSSIFGGSGLPFGGNKPLGGGIGGILGGIFGGSGSPHGGGSSILGGSGFPSGGTRPFGGGGSGGYTGPGISIANILKPRNS